MDTNTVLALCAIFTVVIGIVGLGRNKGTAFRQRKTRRALGKLAG